MDVETNLTLDEYAELNYSAIDKRIAKEVILTIFFLIVIFVDGAIFYTIFCNKLLRTVPNVLFANWAIADFLCAMVTPSGYKILSVMSRGALAHEFLCFIEEFGATLHLTVNLFVIVVLIDWFVAAYFGRASERFRNNYVAILGSIWTLCIAYGGIVSGICFHYFSYLIHHTISLSVSYIVAAVLVVVLQVWRIVQRLRGSCDTASTLNLTFGTVYVIGGALSVVQICTVAYMSAVFEVCLVLTVFGTNIVNFIILLAKNQEFRKCFVTAVRCRSNNDDVQFDFENPIRNMTVNKQRLESESSSIGSQEFLTQIS